MRVEITEPLDLNDEQESLLVMHSFYNVLNVVMMELQFLERMAERDGGLERSLGVCGQILESFHDRERALASVRALESFQSVVREEIDALLATAQLDKRARDLIEESLENLGRVMEVAEVRVKEILARQETGGGWATFSAAQLRTELQQVLEAIAARGRGRFGIVFDPQAQGETDYLVEIEIAGPKGADALELPMPLPDSLRDLTANARKYTAPGGRILARLVDDGAALQVSVRDTGRGIPLDDLTRVVRFGARGVNTRPEETMGGGFGLTKAYYLCKQHGGRMWIDSDLEQGTTISMEIPHPAASARPATPQGEAAS